MFLVILLFLVILFYPYKEHFSIRSKGRINSAKPRKGRINSAKPRLKPETKFTLNNSAVTKLNRDFDSVFVKSKDSISLDRDSYLNLYNGLNIVK
jgi:hypothetical protein